jgi:hypothetical protein
MYLTYIGRDVNGFWGDPGWCACGQSGLQVNCRHFHEGEFSWTSARFFFASSGQDNEGIAGTINDQVTVTKLQNAKLIEEIPG